MMDRFYLSVILMHIYASNALKFVMGFLTALLLVEMSYQSYVQHQVIKINIVIVNCTFWAHS